MNTGTNYIHLIARLRGFQQDYVESVADADGTLAFLNEVAAAIEKVLPAINAWTNPDALRTRIVVLAQNPYSPTDSCDSPEAPLT